MIDQSCGDRSSPAHYGSGYIASPNYPNKYYMNAECVWNLSVQVSRSDMTAILASLILNTSVYDFCRVTTEREVFTVAASRARPGTAGGRERLTFSQ